MKGILLKDWYCLTAYLRIFLIIDLAFIAGAALIQGNAFLLYYPCILSGMISMTLIAYEEREKWDMFACTLPYAKAQMVSGKYLISLLLGLAVTLLTLLSQGISMVVRNSFAFSRLIDLFSVMLSFSLIPTALLLPFIFKFGSEKGRMAYYSVIGGFCGLAVLLGTGEGMIVAVPESGMLRLGLVLLSAGLYTLSWLLSIRLYQKRMAK